MDTCRHMTEDIHVSSVYSKASPLLVVLLLRKGGQCYFSCMCSEQFQEPQFSSHFPFSLSWLLSSGIWQHQPEALGYPWRCFSPLPSQTWKIIKKWNLWVCFTEEDYWKNQDSTVLLGFQLWVHLCCSVWLRAVLCWMPSVPMQFQDTHCAAWVQPPLQISADFLKAWPQ